MIILSAFIICCHPVFADKTIDEVVHEFELKIEQLKQEQNNQINELQKSSTEQIIKLQTQVTIMLEHGLRGIDGRDGRDGNPGRDGSIGNEGGQGDIGPHGSKGDRGALGPIGLAGPVGQKGDMGTRGSKGDRGEMGQLGNPGNNGIQGVAGTTGATGSTGSPGQPGLPGIKGSSASNEGFVGFFGTKTATQSSTQNPYIYDKVHHNPQNSYSAGYYSAPVDGYFYIAIGTWEESSTTQIHLMKGSTVIGRLYQNNNDSRTVHRQVSTLTGIIYLKKDAKIHVKLSSGKIYAENNAYMSAPSMTIFKIGD